MSDVEATRDNRPFTAMDVSLIAKSFSNRTVQSLRFREEAIDEAILAA